MESYNLVLPKKKPNIFGEVNIEKKSKTNNWTKSIHCSYFKKRKMNKNLRCELLNKKK